MGANNDLEREKLCYIGGQNTSQYISDPPCTNKVGESNISIRYCFKYETIQLILINEIVNVHQ